MDRSVINPNQIKTVLKEFRDRIYTDLYPNRDENWKYIPKTLIFAKNDNHASEIVEAVKEVFAENFEDGIVPENFVQKITYSAGDSNALIRDLRTQKGFRIAVTVTLVATGTDVKPLEIVLFMTDVRSSVLYTQMKGRACRSINEDKLKEVTPNAETKDCFYIVDAVGVTESEKKIPTHTDGGNGGKKILPLDKLLEHLAHGELTDDNLILLRDYLSSIQRRYENNPLVHRHLEMFETNFGFSPRDLAETIYSAFEEGRLPDFTSPSEPNQERFSLISNLITNIEARNKLLDMQRGYYEITPDTPDTLIYSDFSKETAKSFVETFEEYLNNNKDKIEALRILFNSENTIITRSMLCDLKDKLISENRQYTPEYIWRNYMTLDGVTKVDEFNVKKNAATLTDLIQIVRYAFKKNDKLVRLYNSFGQGFNLYCGQVQRDLTDEQIDVMRQIAEYIASEGALSTLEINDINADLWRKGIRVFGKDSFEYETETLSKFILRVA